MATTMTLAATILLQAAHRISHEDELLSQLRALHPNHLLLSAILLTVTVSVYHIHYPRTVYLVDYACFQASPNIGRIPKATLFKHQRLSPFLTDCTVNFIGVCTGSREKKRNGENNIIYWNTGSHFQDHGLRHWQFQSTKYK